MARKRSLPTTFQNATAKIANGAADSEASAPLRASSSRNQTSASMTPKRRFAAIATHSTNHVGMADLH